jgi:hypothetical protein
MKQKTKENIEFEHLKGNKFDKLKASKTKRSASKKIVKDHEDEMGKKYYPELVKMESKIKNKKK